MTSRNPADPDTLLAAALQKTSSSARLQSALMAGTNPDPRFIEVLLDRCAVEPDFFVRDMLTWALTRHSSAQTVPRLLDEVRVGAPQARSQALHTLSKIGDPRGWSAITPAVLRDPNDEVARSAWRAAVSLVPAGREVDLATQLCTQLGRGDRETQRSLSRAIAALGDLALPMLAERTLHPDAGIGMHAIVTERLLHDPEEDFEVAVAEAKRVAALTNAPTLDAEQADLGSSGQGQGLPPIR
jgi:HEAT repeat protein